MFDDDGSTGQIQVWIDRLRAGDERSLAELLNHSSNRLLVLTRRMARDFHRLGRWEEAEDVCQNATVRLWSALKATQPTTVAGYYRLAAVQIRRELIDLARRHFGPEGIGANHASDAGGTTSGPSASPAFDRAESTHEPGRLASWAEFHRLVEDLPEEERAAFDLLWYQGLEQSRAAALLGVSEPTLRRRWRSARLRLAESLGGDSPV